MPPHQVMARVVCVCWAGIDSQTCHAFSPGVWDFEILCSKNIEMF